MATHTIRMVGHNIDVVIQVMSDIPETFSEYAKATIRAHYLSVLGPPANENVGAVNIYYSADATTKQISSGIFQTERSVMISVYRNGADGIAREDSSTQRIFRLIITHNYT